MFDFKVSKIKLSNWSRRWSNFGGDGGAGGGEGAVDFNHSEGGDRDSDEEADADNEKTD